MRLLVYPKMYIHWSAITNENEMKLVILCIGTNQSIIFRKILIYNDYILLIGWLTFKNHYIYL